MNRLDTDRGEPAGRWVLSALLVAGPACPLALLPVAIALGHLDLPSASKGRAAVELVD